MRDHEARGAPRGRGRAQGEACADLIRKRLESQRDGETASPQSSRETQPRSRDPGGATPGVAAESSAAGVRAAEALREAYPEGYEECLGIAEATRMPAETYFARAYPAGLASLQCTVWAFRDPDGEPVIAKTDDLPLTEAGFNVTAAVRPNTGYAHRSLHFAGSIWTTAGMNEVGLATGMTGIPGPDIDDTGGYFSLDLLHRVLPECGTVDEAIRLLDSVRVRTYGFSLTLSDADRRLAMVEKTGRGLVELPVDADRGFLHTNHILDHDFARLNPPQKEPIRSNGIRRYEHARELVCGLPRTRAGAFEFLSDRSPNGAIRQKGEDGYRTDYSVVFHRGRMWVRGNGKFFETGV